MSTTAAVHRSRITETEMEVTIRECVQRLGGWCWHVRDSRTHAVEDMPDLIILLPGLLALVELKGQRRGVTDGQESVIATLGTVTDLWHGIVRPIPRPGETSYDDLLALLQEPRTP